MSARSGDDPLTLMYRRFDFSRHPTGDIEFRHNDMCGMLGRFSNFVLRPRAQGLDLHQPDTDPFISQQH